MNRIDRFLTAHGLADVARLDVPGDASVRRYVRVGDHILMICPEDVSGTPYSRAAKLSNNDPLAFCALDHALVQRGFAAPKIVAHDLDAGLVLLEDFGDRLFTTAIAGGVDEGEIYGRAVDVLAALYRSSFPAELDFAGRSWRIPVADAAALQAEADLFLEWTLRAPTLDWSHVWDPLWPVLDGQAPGLALRDFHAENLFALDDGRIGLIDFQDAIFIHPGYDLVSLIEDARRNVDPGLADDLVDRFVDAAMIRDAKAFRAAYAVLGAQRNLKILGIFQRLIHRDGKPRYAEFVPRVEAHLRRDLRHPVLSGLRDWIGTHASELVH